MSWDGRRRQYFMVSVEVMEDPLGWSLQKEFGPAGIAAWVGLLAAAKRNLVEGQITYGSEADGWRALGFQRPPGISLTDFLKRTGQMKQTRLHRRGGLTDVVLTRWEELQKTRRTQVGDASETNYTHVGERKETNSTRLGLRNYTPRRRPGRASDTEGTAHGDEEIPRSEPGNVAQMRSDSDEMRSDSDTDMRSEMEIEIESEIEKKKTRVRDEIFEALIEVWEISLDELTVDSRGSTNRAVKELRRLGATPEEILSRGRIYRALPWNRDCQPPSPSALVKHWPECVPGKLERVDRRALDRELAQRTMDASLRKALETR